jgi:hypothetical protein
VKEWKGWRLFNFDIFVDIDFEKTFKNFFQSTLSWSRIAWMFGERKGVAKNGNLYLNC